MNFNKGFAWLLALLLGGLLALGSGLYLQHMQNTAEQVSVPQPGSTTIPYTTSTTTPSDTQSNNNVDTIDFAASATSGGAPLYVTFSANLPTITGGSGSIVVVTGDGQADYPVCVAGPLGSSAPCGTWSGTFIYKTLGSFTAQLVQEPPQVCDETVPPASIDCTKHVLGTQTIIVNASDSVVLIPTPSYGLAPLHVTFGVTNLTPGLNYRIYYGDASQPVGITTTCNTDCSSATAVVAHDYPVPGPYTVRLYNASKMCSSVDCNMVATADLNVTRNTALRSYPIIAQIDTPTHTLVNGAQSLLRFSITASSTGSIGIGQLYISALTTLGDSFAVVGPVTVFIYSDPAFSQLVPGTSQSGYIRSNDASGPAGRISFDSPLEIPAGATYYFDVQSSLSNVQHNTSFTTNLGGDSGDWFVNNPSTFDAVQGSAFAWSPNTDGVSYYDSTDWENGYGVSGLPEDGISQTLDAVADAPTIDFSAYPATISFDQQSSLTWSTTNADSCTLYNAAAQYPENTYGIIVVKPSGASVYTMVCKGPGGSATKSVTVTAAP